MSCRPLAVRAPAVAAPPHRLDQLSYARLALSSPLVLITRLSPRRYELADRSGAMFGRLIDDLTGDVLAVSHAGAWQCGIRRSWRGWGGVAVDQRSDRVVATYAPRWRKGGALIIGEHEYALRARPGGEHALLDDDGRGVLRLRPVDPEPAGTAFGDDAAVITAAVEVEAQLLDGPDPLMVMLLAIWAADLDREASSRADHSPQGMGL